MRTRFIAFFAAFLLTALGGLSVIAVGDPFEDLGTGIVRPLQVSEVPFKLAVAERASPDLDAILVGSSHIMFLRPVDVENATGLRSINVAIPGALPSEILGMTKVVAKRAPDAHYYVTLDQLVYPEFFDYYRLPPRPAENVVTLYVEAAKLSSAEMLKRSATAILLHMMDVHIKPRWVFSDDGGFHRVQRFPYQLEGTERDHAILAAHERSLLLSIDESTKSTDHRPILKLWQVVPPENLTLIRYPWHPDFPNGLFEHPQWIKAGHLVDRIVADACAAGAQVADLRDWIPDIDDGRLGWVDVDHLGAKASLQAFEAVLSGEHDVC